jgi:hypothetical protein
VGNNAAYSAFQHTIITIYDHEKLDLDLLDALAEPYRGSDIDSGGDIGLTAKDGKTLEEICILVVDPEWIPVKNAKDNTEEYYYKWKSITDERWGW